MQAAPFDSDGSDDWRRAFAPPNVCIEESLGNAGLELWTGVPEDASTVSSPILDTGLPPNWQQHPARLRGVRGIDAVQSPYDLLDEKEDGCLDLQAGHGMFICGLVRGQRGEGAGTRRAHDVPREHGGGHRGRRGRSLDERLVGPHESR
jgi:hypothetical protein